MSNSQFHSRGWFPLLVAAALAGFSWWAWVNFDAQRRYSDVVSLAASIARKFPTNTEVIHRYRREALDMADLGECRSDLLNAGLTVILADLDVDTPEASSDSRVESLRSANEFISHMLVCTPTDGDAWARLAMIHQALGYPAPDVARLLDRSAWFAPSEGATLAARLEVWRQSADATLIAGEATLEHDIFVAINYYSVQDAARALAGGGEKFRKYVNSAAASLSGERAASLRRAGFGMAPSKADQIKAPL